MAAAPTGLTADHRTSPHSGRHPWQSASCPSRGSATRIPPTRAGPCGAGGSAGQRASALRASAFRRLRRPFAPLSRLAPKRGAHCRPPRPLLGCWAPFRVTRASHTRQHPRRAERRKRRPLAGSALAQPREQTASACEWRAAPCVEHRGTPEPPASTCNRIRQRMQSHTQKPCPPTEQPGHPWRRCGGPRPTAPPPGREKSRSREKNAPKPAQSGTKRNRKEPQKAV